MEKALRESQDLNQAVLSSLNSSIAVLNRYGDIIAVNDAWKMFAVENNGRMLAEQSTGSNYLDVCRRAMDADETAARAYTGIKAVLTGTHPFFMLEYPCHAADQKRWFLLHATPLKGRMGGAVISHVNITDRKVMEEQLRENELKMRALLEGIPNGIYVCDTEGRITQTNEAYAKITGYTREQILSMHVWDFMEPGPLKDALPAYLKKIAAEQPPCEPYQCRNVTGSGGLIDVQVDWMYKRSSDGTVAGFFCVLSDVTERKRLEDRMRKQASTDPLTGLLNRTVFLERLRSGLSRAQRAGELLAVAYLDLDDFKAVNDTFGHQTGDELLILTGERLSNCVRVTDTVSRSGGDEYTILLSPILRREDVLTIAEKIVSRLREPMVISGNRVNLTASLGLSLFPDDGEEAETLLDRADIALYHVKRHGKRRFALYAAEMDSGVPAR